MLMAFLCSGFLFVQAAEVVSTADMDEPGLKSILFMGRVAESKPKLTFSDGDSIQVPVSGGSVNLFSNSNAEVEMEQRISSLIGAVEFRPSEGFQYRFKFGQIRSFELEYSSGSQVNKLESTKDGYLWGLSIAGRIAPGSLVSTAIRWDLGYTQSNVELDRFQGGNVVYTANQSWRQEEIQGSINFSRRWKWIEPFGGIKLIRVMNKMSDSSTKGEIRGTNDSVSPFVGVNVGVSNKESVYVEASFIDEESVSAGLKFSF
ncbi:MAG: hypothetical protein KCHDKBKB_00979 [Elusimicrobia bacterium]|nr:hypothetical protein [Elusimicrobiota bacterium]